MKTMLTNSSTKRKSETGPPPTPTNAQNIKKCKMEQDTADSIAQLTLVVAMKQGSSIENQVKDLKASIEFLSADLQDMKEKVKKTEERDDKAEDKIQQLENKG